LIQWEEIRVAVQIGLLCGCIYADGLYQDHWYCWLGYCKFFALPSWNSKKKPIYRGAVHLNEPHRLDIMLSKQSINWMWNHITEDVKGSIIVFNTITRCDVTFFLKILPEIMPICILLETRGVKWLEISMQTTCIYGVPNCAITDDATCILFERWQGEVDKPPLIWPHVEEDVYYKVWSGGMISIVYPGSRLERKVKQQYHINQKSTLILLIHHAITNNQSVQIHKIRSESSLMAIHGWKSWMLKLADKKRLSSIYI